MEDKLIDILQNFQNDKSYNELNAVDDILRLFNVVGRSEQLKCVDKKHYSGITEGKTYKIFKNPNGFNYPHKRFVHITNDLGFVKAYYKTCFEAL